MMDIRDNQEKVLDFYEDTEMDNQEDIEAIRHDTFLLGNGYEAVIFERKFERVREFKTYNNVDEFISDFPNDYQKHTNLLVKLSNGEPVSTILEYNQEVRRSPRRKHIEFEDAIIPLHAKGVEGVNDCEIKGRRVWMKWSDIKENEDEGDYLDGVSNRLTYKAELDSKGMLVPEPEFLNKRYETFEVIYDFYKTIDGKKRKIRSLWNVCLEHKLCLRAIRYPYNHNRTYIIPHSIQFTNKGHYQDGMGRKLHDIHIAGNATINHILDASVLANSLSLKTREGSGAARRIHEHRWFPGSVLELQNIDDAQQFNFSTPNLSSLITMFALIERFGQDVSGVVNYSMGVADSEDPEAPASKTFALMRKAEIKLRRYIKNIKRSENEVGYQSLRLIYQFTPDKTLAGILGTDPTQSKQYLTPPMKVITNASGFAIEKIFAKRDDMTMAGNLLKDPMVMNDPIRRSNLWYTIAKDYGSNWDKKIVDIVPSKEEIIRMQEQVKFEKQQKKIGVGQQTAQKVLEAGGTPEEAKQAAEEAMEYFDNMDARQAQGQMPNQTQGGNQ